MPFHVRRSSEKSTPIKRILTISFIIDVSAISYNASIGAIVGSLSIGSGVAVASGASVGISASGDGVASTMKIASGSGVMVGSGDSFRALHVPAVRKSSPVPPYKNVVTGVSSSASRIPISTITAAAIPISMTFLFFIQSPPLEMFLHDNYLYFTRPFLEIPPYPGFVTKFLPK